MTSVRFGPMAMRRTLTSLMVLAMAAILPVVTIAGVCETSASCCTPSAADHARLARANCCADPCADVTRESSTAADAAKQTQRLERADADGLSMIGVASELAMPGRSVDKARSPESPPDLDRRLASLSLLLI